jgi:hypothetical protein
MEDPLTRLATLATLSPKGARVNNGNRSPRPLGGEGARGTRAGEGVHSSLYSARLIRRRYRLRVPGALALAAVVLLVLGGCKHAPASPSSHIANDQHSQTPAAATAPDAASAPVQVPVQEPRFAVQVAAFDDSDHFGLQTLVAPVDTHGVTLYRVRLLAGSKDEAEKLAETFLNTEKLKVWIVPL